MNERIKKIAEMAKQATKEHFNSDWDGTPRELFDMYFNEKFAELIVKECSAKAWWAEQYNMGDGVPISLQIKRHFGVE